MQINWPQLLQDYGPFALLPFTVVVIERTAAKRAHDVNLPEKTRNRVYAAAWIMIFTLCIAVVFIWWHNVFRTKEAMMKGRVTNLDIDQQLRGTTRGQQDDVRVYTWRNPILTHEVSWRAFSTRPLPEQTELAFVIASSTKDSEETLMFPFKVSQRFYDASMDLQFHYDPMNKELMFDNPATLKPENVPGKQTDILPSKSSGELRLRRPPWFGAVMAQAKRKLSLSEVMANLEADDPLIRLTARRQLASLGAEATYAMDNALRNLDSSYRVKLGVIVAANAMSGFRPEAFSALAWCGVLRAVQSGDNTMKTQANRLLKKQAKPIDISLCSEKRLRQDQRGSAEELKPNKSISPRKK
jgi:hypothetical protein